MLYAHLRLEVGYVCARISLGRQAGLSTYNTVYRNNTQLVTLLLSEYSVLRSFAK